MDVYDKSHPQAQKAESYIMLQNWTLNRQLILQSNNLNSA